MVGITILGSKDESTSAIYFASRVLADFPKTGHIDIIL